MENLIFDPEIINKRNKKLVKYLKQTLCILPYRIISLDTSKMLLTYFAVSGLDILNKLDELPHSSQDIINWIYNHLISENINGIETGSCGFRGSTTLVTDKNKNVQNHKHDCSHLTMTFSALNALLTLGDDLSRLDKKAILKSIQALQLPDGSITATNQDGENDVRFLYSTSCVCFILDDWSFIDTDKAFDFILSCLTYEGAFGQIPGAEAHGGSTFCAVASLYLMNKLTSLSEYQIHRLKQWCLNRQEKGFNGRVNKPIDSCYSFWIGATLKLLDMLHFTNYDDNVNYIFETFDDITGGFSKWPGFSPDPLHTYMGICALSLVNFSSYEKIHPALVISQKAFENLKKIHEK